MDEARQVDGDAVIFYSSQEQYERLTERSGMLREWKVGSGLLLAVKKGLSCLL